MTCEQAFELISLRLDGELDPEQSEALEAHLELCPECKRLAESLRGLDAQLSGLREPAPQSLKRGVLYRIDQATGKAKKPRRWFRPGTAIGAAAAILVLLVGLGVFSLKEPNAASPAKPASDADWIVAPADTASYQGGLSGEGQYFNFSPSGNLALDGTQIIPNGTKAYAGSVFENEASDTLSPEQAPGEALENREQPDSSFADESLLDACAALSREEDAAVLFYRDLDAESLFKLLKAEQPKLYELVEGLEPEERDGMLVCETDCGTALAIQEWLLARLPRSESLDAAEEKAETSLMERMEELDPGSGNLYRIITVDQPERPVVWPEEWAEGWAERMRTGENWALFFPDEDYTPNAEKSAWLVFPLNKR